MIPPDLYLNVGSFVAQYGIEGCMCLCLLLMEFIPCCDEKRSPTLSLHGSGAASFICWLCVCGHEELATLVERLAVSRVLLRLRW